MIRHGETFHLVYLRTGPVLAIRAGDVDWRVLQDRFGDDYMTSLGPWNCSGLIEFLVEDWQDGLEAMRRFLVFAAGDREVVDLTADSPGGDELHMAGPFVIGGWLLDSGLAGGGFGLLFEAYGPDGVVAVAKVAKASHHPGESTQVWEPTPAGPRPIHTPAGAHIRNTGSPDWSRCEVSQGDLVEALRAEADAMARDEGRVLPRLHGLWESSESGEPVLVMEKLSGHPPMHALEVRAVLAVIADAVDRGTFAEHGDLKFEHVFIDVDGSIRVCDPAPSFGVVGVRGFTAEYNPTGRSGPAADVTACASMLRYAGDPTAAGWVAAVLDEPEPPSWLHDHRAALSAFDAALGGGR